MVFYQVFRRGKRYDNRPFGKLLLETDNRARADREFDKAVEKMRNGNVYLFADYALQRVERAYFMRSRW